VAAAVAEAQEEGRFGLSLVQHHTLTQPQIEHPSSDQQQQEQFSFELLGQPRPGPTLFQ